MCLLLISSYLQFYIVTLINHATDVGFPVADGFFLPLIQDRIPCSIEDHQECRQVPGGREAGDQRSGTAVRERSRREKVRGKCLLFQ